MARILSIDYGMKKCGLAATDPLQIIVNGLTTIPTTQLDAYIKAYCAEEEVEEIVVGLPHHPDGSPAQIAGTIKHHARKIAADHPNIKITLHDESYSSQRAREVILNSGLRKKKRRNKQLVDKVSAVLILQDYLQHI